MANIYGRQVIVLLTNKSGGAVVAGDVVVPDGANDSAFTTTTSASVIAPVWVVQESIANNATGRVLIGGYAALVNVNASVTRGNYGATFTVAKQATDGGASRTAGTFCRFLTGGTTPIAYVYPTDLLGSSLTNPMTTKGDIILGDTGGTPSRLGAGASGTVLTSAGAGAFPTWSGGTYTAPSAPVTIQRNNGADYTTASTSYVDMDATNLTATVTFTATHHIRISFGLSCYVSVGTAGYVFAINDGTSDIQLAASSIGTATFPVWVGNSIVLPSTYAAGSHTFKLRFHVAGAATLTVQSNGATQLVMLVVEELPY